MSERSNRGVGGRPKIARWHARVVAARDAVWLATALVFGMQISTLLTLILLPGVLRIALAGYRTPDFVGPPAGRSELPDSGETDAVASG